MAESRTTPTMRPVLSEAARHDIYQVDAVERAARIKNLTSYLIEHGSTGICIPHNRNPKSAKENLINFKSGLEEWQKRPEFIRFVAAEGSIQGESLDPQDTSYRLKDIERLSKIGSKGLLVLCGTEFGPTINLGRGTDEIRETVLYMAQDKDAPMICAVGRGSIGARPANINPDTGICELLPEALAAQWILTETGYVIDRERRSTPRTVEAFEEPAIKDLRSAEVGPDWLQRTFPLHPDSLHTSN